MKMNFITGHIIKETAKAVLVSQSRGNTDGGDVETWLPKSQTDGHEYSRNGNKELYIIVPEWLVLANDLDATECDHPVFGLPVDISEMKPLW